MENDNINIPSQVEKIIYDNPQKPDYYTTSKKKVIDFILGFFGVIIINAIILTASLYAKIFQTGFLFSIVISIIAVVLFFKNGRRFIAVGMISISLLPLLVFGSCVFVAGAGSVLINLFTGR